MSDNDFKFELGDKVVVGTQPGTVTGAAAFSHRNDEFLVSFTTDDDGLPFERWFQEHMIEKQRVH